MNILLLQTDIKWQQSGYNRLHAEKMIETSPHVDIIILPEMFTTGFCMSPQDIAEEADTITLSWMQGIAKEKDAAIAGSVMAEQGGRYYNRLYFVKPDGGYTTYDKKHLFTYSGEHEKYTPGNERVIVEYKGVRILLQICYDLRFPVFSRNRGDYDMIIYVANWPESRISAWNTLLRARAIENVCYVAAANRCGSDPGNFYCGGTALIDFKGKSLAEANPEKEEAVFGEIDMTALAAFRQKFPALDDADDFRIMSYKL